MELREFVRKPFPVKAVQVTADNMAEVARWCGGQVLTITKEGEAGDGPLPARSFVRVPVFQARNDRQQQAYIGDWVLEAERGFKVYTNSAFRNHFEPKQPDTSPLLELVADGQTVLEIPEGI